MMLIFDKISIEKTIEDSKEAYYEALLHSSQGWHKGANDYAPFGRYLLGVLLKTCRELNARSRLLAGEAGATRSKQQQIAGWIEGQIKPFGKRDIMDALPGISKITIERTLATLLKSGAIHKHGAGPATTYTRANR